MKPTILKFPKSQKGRLNFAIKYDSFFFGNYAIIANEPGLINNSQVAAALLAIKRNLQRDGKVYLRLFTHIPVTKKPLEVRMGKGKGSVNHYVTRVQKGSFLFEIKCNSSSKALTALTVAGSKLPISTVNKVKSNP